MKKRISITLGFGVGVLFAYLALKDIDYSKLPGIYSKANLWYLLPSLAVMMAELFFRGIKWKMLLNPAGKISIFNSFRLETIGLALNNILPLRLGEIVRAFWASKISSIPVVTVFSTIFVERVVDAVLLFILFIVAVKLDVSIPAVAAFGKYFWPALGAFGAGMLVLVFIDEIISHKWFSAFFGKHPRIFKFLKDIALGVKAFHDWKTAFGIILTGIIQWSLDALNMYLIAASFNMHSVITFYKSLKLLFAGAIASSIPAMPGFFGNFEYSLVKFMSLWGVDKDAGFAFASYLHLAFYFAVTLAGLFFIYQMGWSVGRIWRKFKNAKN